MEISVESLHDKNMNKLGFQFAKARDVPETSAWHVE